MRDLEIRYEVMYQEYYDLRREIVSGATVTDGERVEIFDKRAEELDDQ
jgi:hypothetical protein